MELLTKLGVDWRLLLAQIINFIILLAILYKFLYRPVLNLLDKRSKTIEKSLEDAKKLEEKVRIAEEEREKKIVATRREAQKILEETGAQAEKNRVEMIAKAKSEVAKVMANGQTQLAQAKEKMFREVKAQVGELVVEATRQVLAEAMDEKIDKNLVEKTLKELK